MKPRVIIESPYAGDVDRNIDYASACMIDSIERGEAPFASHMLYPQVLDDLLLCERMKGMACGFAWLQAAEKVAVYTDRGISPGMLAGIKQAEEAGVPVEYRKIR